MNTIATYRHQPWNKGKLVGQKAPFRLRDIWVIRVRHTMRRKKAPLIYRRTNNLGAVQLLFGHIELEGSVRCLGIKVDDALEMAEQTEV